MAYRIEKVSCVKLGFTIRIFVTAGSASREELLGLSGIWSVIKFAAAQANLDPKSVWPKVLQESFRKTLNATESLDIDEVREKYIRVNWGREGGNGGKLKELEEANKDLGERVSSLENRTRSL